VPTRGTTRLTEGCVKCLGRSRRLLTQDERIGRPRSRRPRTAYTLQPSFPGAAPHNAWFIWPNLLAAFFAFTIMSTSPPPRAPPFPVADTTAPVTAGAIRFDDHSEPTSPARGQPFSPPTQSTSRPNSDATLYRSPSTRSTLDGNKNSYFDPYATDKNLYSTDTLNTPDSANHLPLGAGKPTGNRRYEDLGE
jgi:hypothetical protein